MKSDINKRIKKDIDKRTHTRLAKNHACYVLITCDEAKADGNMQVKMTYEGDPILAAFLLQGAQTMLDEQALECYEEACNGLQEVSNKCSS